MATVPVSYAGPLGRGVTLDGVRVRPGEHTRVDAHRAAALLRQDDWKLAVDVGELGKTDTVKAAKSWVGKDPDRAAAVLLAELGDDKPRETLVEHLEQLLDDHAAAQAEAAAEAAAAEPDPDDQGPDDPGPDDTAGDGEEA